MIKCGSLPLNVDSFFDFNLKSCGSVIQDAKTLIGTECDIVENYVDV